MREEKTFRVVVFRFETDASTNYTRYMITKNYMPFFPGNQWLELKSIRKTSTGKEYAKKLVAFLNWLDSRKVTYENATNHHVREFLHELVFGNLADEKVLSLQSSVGYSTLTKYVTVITGFYGWLDDMRQTEMLWKKKSVQANCSFLYGQIYSREYRYLIDGYAARLKSSRDYTKWYDKATKELLCRNFNTLRDEAVLRLTFEGFRIDEVLSVTLDSYDAIEQLVQPTRSKGRANARNGENKLRLVALPKKTCEVTSVEKILHEVKKVIAGKDDVLEKIMMTVLSRGHVLLDDVPGTGKTTTALAFSRALGLRYGRIQFTPDVLPSDIVGFSMYHKESGSFAYQPGAVMTNLLLADEINRTSSKTQSALLEVMEERQVTVDGQTHKLPDPFVVIATQNPVGSAGTQLLPQAQLDRFMVRLEMGYPDFASQVNILRDRQAGDPLEAVATVSSGLDLLTMQAQAQQVHMADAMLEYVTSLAEASRSHPLVVLGVSPRGALAVCRMCKSRAFMEGRDYVLPDDVAYIFADVCAHRLILSPKAKITETTAKDVLAEVLQQVARPDHI